MKRRRVAYEPEAASKVSVPTVSTTPSPVKFSRYDEHALRASMNALPIEILLMIAHNFGDAERNGGDDAPRSRATESFLHVLMTSSSTFRSITRPLYWSEVRVASKSQWLKLKGLLRSNKFKKTPAVVDPAVITTLNIDLERTGEAYGGLGEAELIDMADTLHHVQHLRVSCNEQVRLIGRPSKISEDTYLKLLSRFGLQHADCPAALTRLSLTNVYSEPFANVLLMLVALPFLQHVSVDNVWPRVAGVGEELQQYVKLADLQSFTVRNSSNISISAQEGFHFLNTSVKALTKLVLRDCHIETALVRSILQKHADSLEHLELCLAGLPSTPSRFYIEQYAEQGTWSYDTGGHMPLSLLQDTNRVGDDAARLCKRLTYLAAGGLNCISPALLDNLLANADIKLHTLRLVNAWPLRPTRPQHDSASAQERQLTEDNPSGVSPAETLESIEEGLKISRLELQNMGPEWNLTTEEDAKAVRTACEKVGIQFVVL